MQFVFELNQVGIDKNTAEFAFDQIYSKILQDTEQDDIIDILMTALESRKFLYPTSNDKFTQKLAFAKKYSKLLQEFGKEISKREQIDVKNLYDIAISFDIFGHDISMKISKYLFQKMFDDRELLKPWKCKHCFFVNCELMIDGLWRLYNQINKCGLCGTIENSNNGIQSQQAQSKIHFDQPKQETIAIQLPDDILQEWSYLDDVECKLMSRATGSNVAIFVKDLSHEQLVYLLKEHCFDQIKDTEKLQLLQDYKLKIIEYFNVAKLNGLMFHSISKKGLIEAVTSHCNNKKLTGVLRQLYKIINEFDLNLISLPSIQEESKQTAETEIETDDICAALSRINVILKHFDQLTNDLPNTNHKYPYTMKSFLSSLSDYTPVKLLNDMEHIIDHQFAHQHTICPNGSDCIHLKRAMRDRNTDSCKILSLKKELFNCDIIEDFIYISMLDRAHSILMHSPEIKANTIQLLKQDVKYTEIPIYSTGVYMEYHTLKPLYANLKDEVTQNRMYKITDTQFQTEIQSAKLFMVSENIANNWRANKSDKRYGIKIDEKMHIEHILCVSLYCNHSKLCEKFRQSYRKQQLHESNDTIIQRHCRNFYWYGRFLKTAIAFWGQTAKKKDIFYHGLSRKFLFNELSTVYEIPTSTTDDISVAHPFSKDFGIVLKLGPKWKNEINSTKCLDVSKFSEFKHEKEKLFAGMTVLSILDIYVPSDNKWDGYGGYIKSILYFERITEQTVHQKDYYNYGIVNQKNKEKWLQIQQDYLLPLIQ
eukprot:418288_1